MSYNLSIREWNLKPHIDVESDIQKQKDGLFTFTIRLNNGNIVDYVVTQHVNPREKYGIVKTIVVEEFTISRDLGGGGTRNPVGNDNF